MHTILIIEDEKDILDNLTDLLEVSGYASIGASNGEDGVKRAHEHQPDLILCDLRMPGLDGHEVLDSIRASDWGREVPFIFLTASAEPGVEQQSLQKGATDYIRKPFSVEDLMDTIEQVLSSRRPL